MKISLIPVFLRAAFGLSFAALVWYEHTLVKADNFENIPMAFFNVNAAVSLSLLGFAVGDVLAKIVF